MAGIFMLAASSMAFMTAISPLNRIQQPATTDDDFAMIADADSSVLTGQSRAAITDSAEAPHFFEIYCMTRGYNDRNVLRWMPDEYVSFRYGIEYGYVVLRDHYEGNKYVLDTLARCLKPLSIEEFKTRFAPTDSLAGAALQCVYGRSVSLDQTEAAPGTPGSILEVYEQQQQLFGYGALVADLRPDLAQAMGLMYVDRTADPSVDYTYMIRSLAPDSLFHVRHIMAKPVKMGEYKPSAFNAEITDSIAYPDQVILSWPQTGYTAYDIERRTVKAGQGAESGWKKLNTRPYICFQTESTPDDNPNYYADRKVPVGNYEYRIFALDAFGDRTLPCQVHRVTVPDLVGPHAPDLYHIDILRGDTTIDARLQWHMDTIDNDLHGFLPMYNLPRVMGTQWIPLSRELLPRTALECTVSVRGLETGKVCIAAVDSAGNITYSLPQEVRIGDNKAPDAPTNLRYTSEIGTPEELKARDNQGLIRLMWNAPADRDIDYYEVEYANDPTHMFLKATFDGKMRDCQFVDTVSLEVNQKYIYYRVRAIDYATNEGEWSDMIEVLRPSLVVPSVPHLESASQDDNAIHQSWIVGAEVQIARHYVYRRHESEKEWTLLAVCDADSVIKNDYRISFDDRPRAAKGHWQYALVSETGTGITSGFSLVYSVKFNAYRRIPCPITIDGDCLNNKKNETRLVWDINGTLPDCDDWYYCVYRKGPKDKDFKYLISVPKTESSHSDFLIRPGESAQYYVKIRMPGIGESDNSNVVTVNAKKP